MKYKITASVTLILLGYELDPNQVSQALDLVPSQVWRKGENHTRTKNDGTVEVWDSVHQWGGWKLWLPDELHEMSLEAQLDQWLQILNARAAEVKGLKAQGLTIQLNCYLSAKVYCLNLPAAFQAQFGDLGVDLEVAFYSVTRRPTARQRRRMLRRR